jgi:hypothetical protein
LPQESTIGGSSRSDNKAIQSFYHVQGENARVSVGGSDNSVNVVVKTSTELFTTMRDEIQSQIPAGDQQTAILDKLV